MIPLAHWALGLVVALAALTWYLQGRVLALQPPQSGRPDLLLADCPGATMSRLLSGPAATALTPEQARAMLAIRPAVEAALRGEMAEQEARDLFLRTLTPPQRRQLQAWLLAGEPLVVRPDEAWRSLWVSLEALEAWPKTLPSPGRVFSAPALRQEVSLAAQQTQLLALRGDEKSLALARSGFPARPPWTAMIPAVATPGSPRETAAPRRSP